MTVRVLLLFTFLLGYAGTAESIGFEEPASNVCAYPCVNNKCPCWRWFGSESDLTRLKRLVDCSPCPSPPPPGAPPPPPLPPELEPVQDTCLDKCTPEPIGSCTCWRKILVPALPSETHYFIRKSSCPCQDGKTIGDPHFQGYDGKQYSFMGVPNKVFSIISEPQVAVNALFGTTINGTGTELRKLCINHCGTTIVFDGFNQTVEVDGSLVDGNGLRYFKSDILMIEHEGERKVKVQANLGDRWDLRIQMVYRRVDLLHSWPNLTSTTPMHGVLGHTWNLPKNSTSRCNDDLEGGCEVTGQVEDYEVDSLCSPIWKYSQWTGEGCGI